MDPGDLLGALSITAVIIGLTWRISRKVTLVENTLATFAKTNNIDLNRIIKLAERHDEAIINNRERIAKLECRSNGSVANRAGQ